MRMIESIAITPGMLTSSTVPENDHPAWAAGTTYALGAKVTKGHHNWESLQAANQGHDPEADAASNWWVNIGATNRWCAFDGKLAPLTSQAADITYVITLNQRVDSIALFGLIGTAVRITCKDGAGATQYDKTSDLPGARQIGGWWDWFFEPFAPVPSLILSDVPGFVGWTITITIAGTGSRAVAEILIGRSVTLGTTLVDTAIGFRDFSVKERDAWGGWQILERGYSRTVDYRFSMPQKDVDRVMRAVMRARARMCVFSAGPDTDIFGTTILGFVNEDGLSIPITTNICFATLSVEGLTEE